MAAITATDASVESSTVTVTTLDGADTLVFRSAIQQTLILDNATGGSLTVLIDGDGSTTTTCPGVGDIDVSGGKSYIVADGTTRHVSLGRISEYLKGVVNVTGGTGITASLLER